MNIITNVTPATLVGIAKVAAVLAPLRSRTLITGSLTGWAPTRSSALGWLVLNLARAFWTIEFVRFGFRVNLVNDIDLVPLNCVAAYFETELEGCGEIDRAVLSTFLVDECLGYYQTFVRYRIVLILLSENPVNEFIGGLLLLIKNHKTGSRGHD